MPKPLPLIRSMHTQKANATLQIECTQASSKHIEQIVTLLNSPDARSNLMPLSVDNISQYVQNKEVVLAYDTTHRNEHKKLVGCIRLSLLKEKEHASKLLKQLEVHNLNPPFDSGRATLKNDKIHFQQRNSLEDGNIKLAKELDAVFMYLGTSFTLPEYRNRGIMTQLTDTAFTGALSWTLDILQNKPKSEKRICVMYGVGNPHYFDVCRSVGTKPFLRFLNRLSLDDSEVGITYSCYKHCRPDSNECVPAVVLTYDSNTGN